MSLFTFLVLEIVTADLCVTGLSEDLWGFSDIVEFSQSILKHDTSEHILCQSQAFRPPLFLGGALQWHMEVPKPGLKSEPQLCQS